MVNGGVTSAPKNSSRVPTFWCKGCLEDVPLSSRSWDFRYCRSCCSFLESEAKIRVGVKESKDWVPRQSPSPVNLWFEEGDRVQLLSSRDVDGILDDWIMVSSASQGLVTVIVGTKIKQVPFSRVVAHQKADYYRAKSGDKMEEQGEDTVKKQNPTPSEIYAKVKQMLDKLTASGADPRIIGLWKSKLEHAERLCKDVGVEPNAITAETSVATVLPSISAEPTESVQPVMPAPMILERSGDEMPAEVKATIAMPKAQRALKKASPMSEKPPEEPKPVSHGPTFCLCGCGGQTSHHREFLQGHDARLGSYIRRLDAGKVKLEELPESVQKLVRENHYVVVRIRSHIVKK